MFASCNGFDQWDRPCCITGVFTMKRIQIIIILSSLLTLNACSWWGNKDDVDNGPYKGMSAKQLFTDAENSIRQEEYGTASKRLEALESMYPFSDYAEQAQLDLIYAYYKNDDFPSSAATAERFTRLYPRAKHVDYAYYMRGLANFQQSRGSLTNVLPIDESWRDPGTQLQAYADFGTLIQQFPNSRYRANALQRMIYLRNMFAQHELNVSKYYFERKMYVAATNRASALVKNYQQSPCARDALIVMYRANKAMGLTKAANDALEVYRATYHSEPSV